MNETITAVPGVQGGHAVHAAAPTGCTVLLGPFRGAVDVRGLATGTREIDALSPRHVVPRIDALLFTGGSAPGLAAADGVVQWLRERGVGYAVGITRIPIVPAAVIFDIHMPGQPSPDAALGRAACAAASAAPLATGRVGAGAGATIGKGRGPAFASHGGIGSYATTHRGYRIGALAVVNAFGDVLDFDGTIIAGTRDADGHLVDSMQLALAAPPQAASPVSSTTLCAVATDAPLSRTALQTLARMGSSAVVRRIAPANTVFDGDVVFALSTAGDVRDFAPGELLGFGVAAQLTLEEAIVRAGRVGRAA